MGAIGSSSDHSYSVNCDCAYCSDARSALLAWRIENADRIDLSDEHECPQSGGGA